MAIDLFCGLGGWTEGFLVEGWEVIGFDIERHHYGDQQYPAQLVLQDVRTIHGSQFKDAQMIVASSPCQAYSYMAMPWTRAKQIAKALRSEGDFPEGYTGYRTIEALNELFVQPARIQREASEAAGHRIPMVQENVRGAIPWVGRSQWNFGSFHLWGDVPALMPNTKVVKLGGGASWYPPEDPRHQPGLDFTRLAGQKLRSDVSASIRAGKSPSRWTNPAEWDTGSKNSGGSWFNIGSRGQNVVNQNPVAQYVASIGVDPEAGTKGYAARLGESTISRRHGSKSKARKAASAAIAKIPEPLARHIAYVYHPDRTPEDSSDGR